MQMSLESLSNPVFFIWKNDVKEVINYLQNCSLRNKYNALSPLLGYNETHHKVKAKY
jgi:hypothetical protein